MTEEMAAEDYKAFFESVAMGHGGCKCDPPGSGEEYCVDTCYERARTETAERERDEAHEVLRALQVRGWFDSMRDVNRERDDAEWADRAESLLVRSARDR